jgi:signal transduction histidine kinase/DNA-binding NarL/FixJ family response regulator
MVEVRNGMGEGAMQNEFFGSDSWRTALDRYAEATGMTVRVYGADAQVALDSAHITPLVSLYREHGFDPGLFDTCARRCLMQTYARPIVLADEQHGLTVIGAPLVLEDVVVGAAVAGYALARFPNVSAVRRWAQSARLPFHRLWEIVRKQSPVPERRLALHGDLLRVLGEALLREGHRALQHEDAVAKLKAAAAAKDDFLAVLSHELRAPLAPIVGWAGVMKKSESMEHVRTAAEAIERNALLQSRMVDDLLDTSRIAHRVISLDLQTHDLSALLRAAVEMSVQDMRRQAIRLEFSDSPEPLFVRGDAGRLQQVFRNIISNAVKFTPGDGSIRIAISGVEGNAQVTITDSGVGITPEFLPFVFDIFRQQEQSLRRKHDGLGIGLALVKQLTELHQGTVAISSAGTGTGAAVTVRFPLVAGAPARAEPAEAAPQAAVLAGFSILVVEHSQDSREFMRILLQGLGATVSVARNGAAALETTLYFDPDVVLCDLRLPRMDGYEFLSELRRRPVHPPVIAMSGLAGEGERGRAREAGFHAHIRKPFDGPAVIAAVQAAVRDRKERPSAAPRAERRFIPRRTGDRSAGSARESTLAASRDDARKCARADPDRPT